MSDSDWKVVDEVDDSVSLRSEQLQTGGLIRHHWTVSNCLFQ